jgi:hypothetical protein
MKKRDSVVGIATGYGLGDQGFGVRDPVWATQPSIQWVPGVLSPAVKRPGRKVKKMWIYTSTPPYAFMV